MTDLWRALGLNAERSCCLEEQLLFLCNDDFEVLQPTSTPAVKSP